MMTGSGPMDQGGRLTMKIGNSLENLIIMRAMKTTYNLTIGVGNGMIRSTPLRWVPCASMIHLDHVNQAGHGITDLKFVSNQFLQKQ